MSPAVEFPGSARAFETPPSTVFADAVDGGNDVVECFVFGGKKKAVFVLLWLCRVLRVAIHLRLINAFWSPSPLPSSAGSRGATKKNRASADFQSAGR